MEIVLVFFFSVPSAVGSNSTLLVTILLNYHEGVDERWLSINVNESDLTLHRTFMFFSVINFSKVSICLDRNQCKWWLACLYSNWMIMILLRDFGYFVELTFAYYHHVYLTWASGIPRRTWKALLARGMSLTSCLSCCHHDPTLDGEQ